MKVAYFSNQFATNNGHGVARYAHHLFESLRNVPNAPEVIPVAAWSNRQENSLKLLQQETGLEILPWGRRLTALAWNYVNYPLLETGMTTSPDIIHAVSLGYRIATNKPYVVTVHDIGPLTHPQFFDDKPPWIMEKSLKQAVHKADRFICVSQATANELQEYVSSKYRAHLDDRIQVIEEGVSKNFYDVPDANKLEDLAVDYKGLSYILTVGKISPRKNMEAVIEALYRLKDVIPHHIIAIGGDGWSYEKTKNRVHELKIEDRVHFAGYVSDELLVELYRRASVFVYPSLFEGFGLTVLEAMAAGCPVITSNLSSLPEVAGDAAALVDPNHVGELADRIEEICINQNLADRMRQQGVARSRKFTWEKCAFEVSNVYQSLKS